MNSALVGENPRGDIQRPLCLSPLRLLEQNPTAWAAYRQQPFISHGPGGCSSQLKVMADVVSGEGLLPGLQRADFSWCLHMVHRGAPPTPRAVSLGSLL